MHDDNDAPGDFRAVINDQAQYALWPATRVLPTGWRDAGYHGARADCLQFIRRAWTDQRPLAVQGVPRSAATASAAKEMRP